MNKKEIQETFLFHYNEKNIDKFFCPCGTNFSVSEKIEEKEFVLKTKNNSAFNSLNMDDIVNEIDLKAECPNCKKTISEFSSSGKKIEVNKKFYKNFHFEENELEISLSKSLFEGEYDEYFDKLLIKETGATLVFEKNTKQIKFIHNENSSDIDLDTVFEVVSKFYFTEKENDTVKLVDNLMDIHIFIGRLANYIKDAKNIDFLSGLMDEINGTRNIVLKDALPTLTKITCILLSIAKYEALSTIALTKNALFLFELLKDCDLPKSNDLIEKKVTKPVQIFSFLINLENKKIQENIDKEDNKKQKIVYKSVKLLSGEEFNLSDGFNFSNKTKGVKKSNDGTLVLEDGIDNKQISPLIYKKIKSIKDYKKLIKYTKFIEYNNLVNLTKKYDIELLNDLFVYLEFRGDLNINRINYFLNLYTDFKNSKDLLRFNFAYYVETFDDCLRMIHSLKWDVNKHLLNIKKCSELVKYHDWLVETYNLTQQKESNIKYQNFVKKFKDMEEYESKDIKIKLISTIESLMFWAKELNNCSASYATRVLSEQYLLAIVEYKTLKEDSEKNNLRNFMMGFTINKRGLLEFDQLKSTNNQRGTDRFKMLVMDYLIEKDITFREVADLSTNFVVKNNVGINNILEDLVAHAPQIATPAAEHNDINFAPYLMANVIDVQPNIEERIEERMVESERELKEAYEKEIENDVKIDFNSKVFISPGISTMEHDQNNNKKSMSIIEKIKNFFSV